jgi:osmotically-inducible protein OsmY
MFETTDHSIAAAVRVALASDPLVPDRDLTVSVLDGWVTIEGSVEHEWEREQVEHAVLGIEGVRGMTNDLGVWPPDLESGVIRETLEEALELREDSTSS